MPAREKRCGLAAPVVHQGGRPAQRGNADGRRGEQMPCPAGVGHNVREIGAAHRAPQRDDVRHETEQRAHAAHATDPRGAIGRVGANDGDAAALRLEQTGELSCLVGHAARRRWQRPHQHDCTWRGERSARRVERACGERHCHVTALCGVASRLRASRAPQRNGVASQGVKRGSSWSASPIRAAPQAVETAAAKPSDCASFA